MGSSEPPQTANEYLAGSSIAPTPEEALTTWLTSSHYQANAVTDKRSFFTRVEDEVSGRKAEWEAAEAERKRLEQEAEEKRRFEALSAAEKAATEAEKAQREHDEAAERRAAEDYRAKDEMLRQYRDQLFDLVRSPEQRAKPQVLLSIESNEVTEGRIDLAMSLRAYAEPGGYQLSSLLVGKQATNKMVYVPAKDSPNGKAVFSNGYWMIVDDAADAELHEQFEALVRKAAVLADAKPFIEPAFEPEDIAFFDTKKIATDQAKELGFKPKDVKMRKIGERQGWVIRHSGVSGDYYLPESVKGEALPPFEAFWLENNWLETDRDKIVETAGQMLRLYDKPQTPISTNAFWVRLTDSEDVVYVGAPRIDRLATFNLRFFAILMNLGYLPAIGAEVGIVPLLRKGQFFGALGEMKDWDYTTKG